MQVVTHKTNVPWWQQYVGGAVGAGLSELAKGYIQGIFDRDKRYKESLKEKWIPEYTERQKYSADPVFIDQGWGASYSPKTEDEAWGQNTSINKGLDDSWFAKGPHGLLDVTKKRFSDDLKDLNIPTVTTEKIPRTRSEFINEAIRNGMTSEQALEAGKRIYGTDWELADKDQQFKWAGDISNNPNDKNTLTNLARLASVNNNAANMAKGYLDMVNNNALQTTDLGGRVQYGTYNKYTGKYTPGTSYAKSATPAESLADKRWWTEFGRKSYEDDRDYQRTVTKEEREYADSQKPIFQNAWDWITANYRTKDNLPMYSRWDEVPENVRNTALSVTANKSNVDNVKKAVALSHEDNAYSENYKAQRASEAITGKPYEEQTPFERSLGYNTATAASNINTVQANENKDAYNQALIDAKNRYTEMLARRSDADRASKEGIAKAKEENAWLRQLESNANKLALLKGRTDAEAAKQRAELNAERENLLTQLNSRIELENVRAARAEKLRDITNKYKVDEAILNHALKLDFAAQEQAFKSSENAEDRGLKWALAKQAAESAKERAVANYRSREAIATLKESGRLKAVDAQIVADSEKQIRDLQAKAELAKGKQRADLEKALAVAQANHNNITAQIEQKAVLAMAESMLKAERGEAAERLKFQLQRELNNDKYAAQATNVNNRLAYLYSKDQNKLTADERKEINSLTVMREKIEAQRDIARQDAALKFFTTFGKAYYDRAAKEQSDSMKRFIAELNANTRLSVAEMNLRQRELAAQSKQNKNTGIEGIQSLGDFLVDPRGSIYLNGITNSESPEEAWKLANDNASMIPSSIREDFLSYIKNSKMLPRTGFSTTGKLDPNLSEWVPNPLYGFVDPQTVVDVPYENATAGEIQNTQPQTIQNGDYSGFSKVISDLMKKHPNLTAQDIVELFNGAGAQQTAPKKTQPKKKQEPNPNSQFLEIWAK